MPSKEVKEIIAKLEKQGWRIEDGRHFKAFPPDKLLSMVVIPKTPSDNRSLKNTISELKKRGAIL